MMRRQHLLAAAFACALVSSGAVVNAQHPQVKSGVAGQPAASPQQASEGTKPKKPTTPPSRSSQADLERAVMRIVDELRKPEPPGERSRAASSSSAARRPAPAREPALPRLKLSWRLSLVWPDEKQPATDDTGNDRVHINWR